jgi:hypothetical protein
MTNEPVKRGRGRPRKYTEDNPKPKIDPNNPLEVIRKPANPWLPATTELPEGDNNKYTTFALSIMQLPKIDYADPQQLQQRVYEYFRLCAEHDMKPAVTALSLALGMNRRRLWEIKTDQQQQLVIPQECKDIIKTAYDSLEMLWESYMQNGKINPVSGIFLAKNHYGYKDQQEYVVTPNQMGESTSPDVIEAKYDELPE